MLYYYICKIVICLKVNGFMLFFLNNFCQAINNSLFEIKVKFYYCAYKLNIKLYHNILVCYNNFLFTIKIVNQFVYKLIMCY